MNKTGREFEGILERYFERLLEDVPTYATVAAGLSSGEGKLGSMGAEFHAERQRQRQAAFRALEALSPRELTGEQHLDRLALRSLLCHESEDFARGRHELEPAAPALLLDILFHELLRGDDHPARAARNLRSLLRQAPDFLDEAVGALNRPDPLWLKVMEQNVAGAGDLLDGVAQFLRRTGPEDGDDASVRAARRSIQRYADRARNRPTAPEGSFALGAEGMQRRIRDELGLDYTLKEVESFGLAEVARIEAALDAECARFGRGRSAAGIIAEARAAWRPAQPLVELYERETRRIAQGFRRARAMTFPEGDELRVKPVPEFLRTLIPTAAYSQPGAFARRQRGIFWVNDPATRKGSEAEKRAEQQQHFGLALTCAHEAYPGHHLQFVTANRHPRQWRRLFAHAVFYEGWTLWCEQMMADLKVDRSPWLRVQQLHDALWRCHRVLVDLRLQTGRYTSAQAARHLQRHLGFTRTRAEAEINWYSAQPAVPMSYWLGRQENERLKRRLMDGRGWSLRRFNDWLLSFGTLPQSWIEKYGLD